MTGDSLRLKKEIMSLKVNFMITQIEFVHSLKESLKEKFGLSQFRFFLLKIDCYSSSIFYYNIKANVESYLSNRLLIDYFWKKF
ncbi:hypothetical protein BpHYR1_038828 [Brachionus plicatilis]|uniref:Uncharacterized protein n=1 Tax=Brachionus plicatilis TaxID=10195 RepID=A0A3M7SAB4_BRAPC|nr:hypothetical protein BpHYR1_038828 [Brachionus plicatilis]